MGTKTNIRWTDTTWNPVIGCSKVSPGCAHCYAEQLSFSPKMRPFGYTGLPWTPANAEANVQLKPERLEQPLHWRDPRRVFVNSMSDLFHELVPDEYLRRVFKIMAACPKHIFQVLTKRPERMRDFVRALEAEGDFADLYGNEMRWPIPNVWVGTSVENQHWADIRIPLLLATPAAVRFLSCEPLLGPLDLCLDYLDREIETNAVFWWHNPQDSHPCDFACSGFETTGLHWVIVGGESGPEYRPMNLDWARSLRDQCLEAEVAFFFKQAGGRRSETGTLLDGVAWEQFPEVAA